MKPHSARRRGGGVLVETAFALPIFLVLVLGVVELATVSFVRAAMLNAARDAVRSYSIGELDASEVSTLAASRLPAVGVNFTVTTSPDSGTSLDRWVEISAPLSEAALNDPLGLWGSDQLRVRVTMRVED